MLTFIFPDWLNNSCDFVKWNFSIEFHVSSLEKVCLCKWTFTYYVSLNDCVLIWNSSPFFHVCVCVCGLKRAAYACVIAKAILSFAIHICCSIAVIKNINLLSTVLNDWTCFVKHRTPNLFLREHEQNDHQPKTLMNNFIHFRK